MNRRGGVRGGLNYYFRKERGSTHCPGRELWSDMGKEGSERSVEECRKISWVRLSTFTKKYWTTSGGNWGQKGRGRGTQIGMRHTTNGTKKKLLLPLRERSFKNMLMKAQLRETMNETGRKNVTRKRTVPERQLHFHRRNETAT